MPNIPGFPLPIPGTPLYPLAAVGELETSDHPMIYTTDGPLPATNGISFTTTEITFDPSQVSEGLVTKLVAGPNITLTPSAGTGEVTITAASSVTPAATPTVRGTVFGFYDSAKSNVGFGPNVLQAVAAGSSLNVGVGANNLDALTTGQQNTSVGAPAGGVLTTGSRNTMVGAYTGNALTSGNNNTLLGQSAGIALTNSSGNTFVGYQAGAIVTTGANNTILGGYQGASTISNQTILSDGAGNLRLWINNNGAIGVGTGASYGTTGQVLTSQGSAGAAQWSTPFTPWNTTSGSVAAGNLATVFTTNIAANGVLSLWGTLTVYSGANVMQTYSVQVLNTYNTFTGVSGQNTVTQTLTYTNPTAPEPVPSCTVLWQTGQGGGAVTLLLNAANGGFNYVFTYTRLV